jgi:hypothetical protein
MNTFIMSDSHQTSNPWAWQLAPRQATTLAAEAETRWLRVEQGNVWITRRNGPEQADDIWLGAGESLALPAGSEWVLEGWPQARLSLLLEAPAALKGGAATGRAAGAWWRPDWLRAAWV